MYSDRRVLLSVAQKIEQFATSCVWQNFHWNTVKHKLHRVYILFFCDQFKRLDSRLWKGENFLFSIFDLDTSAWHSSCDIVNPATLIIWWMTFGNHRTICTVFRSAAPHLSSSSNYKFSGTSQHAVKTQWRCDVDQLDNIGMAGMLSTWCVMRCTFQWWAYAWHPLLSRRTTLLYAQHCIQVKYHTIQVISETFFRANHFGWHWKN